MRIIAVDDEKLALDALVGAIRKAAPEAEIYAFDDPVEALDFLQAQPCEVVFLDVEMPEMSGVELAKRMKMIDPNINIIFSTGYDQYRGVAFGMHASGYLTKPILPEDVKWELADLRRPVQLPVTRRVRVQAFGNFEVFLDGAPMRFKYERTKEMFAYLVDRAGAYCTSGELLGILFENESGHEAYLKKLRQDLLDTFNSAGCGQVIVHRRGRLAVDPDQIDCDYYDWRKGKGQAIHLFRGEYMIQYSWAEFRYGSLQF